MKTHRLIALLFATAAASVAHAGSTGAGPAASAAPAVGSIITPGSHVLLDTPARDDVSDRITPGNGGELVLSGEQLARTEAALRGFDGATVENNLLRAPTVLADGTAAVIALNLKTGKLSVTRQER
jgi:hypothetical protein